MAAASWVIPYPLEPREAEAYAVFVDLVSNFRSVSFNHVKRGGNKIAHELAQLAPANPNSLWMEDAPIHVLNLALLDLLVPVE
ncbi:hypothetical protein AHAS_Ahas06G0232400 [Arachis hypogaea]